MNNLKAKENYIISFDLGNKHAERLLKQLNKK